MISTLILNWNRADLLRVTVESYLKTAGHNIELFIIDNASTDDSRNYLCRLEKESAGRVKIFYLDENLGGEAYNIAIPSAAGDLIHLSENDQLFLPGWVDHVKRAFETFSDLGQLSLFSDTPEDGEVWDPKPSRLRFAQGKILYEAYENVGTSSVLRAELFRNYDLAVKNIESGAFRFPNDAALSRDVKAAGYWVAWSDRYYVRNMGHEVSEFLARPAYYEENYSSKPWEGGVDGWRKKVEKQGSTPKPLRSSPTLPTLVAIPERTLADIGGKPSRLWSMFDGWTAEVEVVDFLYALTRVVKPSQVLETGTWLGLSSCAIAKALVSNGFGHLTTLEIKREAHENAIENIRKHDVAHVVSAILEPSMEFEPSNGFDMILFDSAPELLIAEFRRFLPWLKEGAIVIFHGTEEGFGVVIQGVDELVRERAVVGVDLPTPRGLFVGKVAVS